MAACGDDAGARFARPRAAKGRPCGEAAEILSIRPRRIPKFLIEFYLLRLAEMPFTRSPVLWTIWRRDW